jgi:hypothetical protein
MGTAELRNYLRQHAAPVVPGAGLVTRLLEVENSFFKAQLTFEKKYGVWACVKAQEPLSWAAGQPPGAIHLALLKMGAEYHFGPVIQNLI